MSSPIITHTWPQNRETDNVFLEKTEVQQRTCRDGREHGGWAQMDTDVSLF
jgi:hypothetical protein